MDMINGFRIISDENFTKIDGTKKVKKTWRERFVWRFWEEYKEVPNVVPRKDVVLCNEYQAIICHPSMKSAILEEAQSWKHF